MPNGSRLPLFLFLGLTAVILVGSAIAFVNAVRWINRPFAGFLIYDPPYVDSLGLRDWEGKKAGLSYLDRVIAADHTPIRRGRELVDRIAAKPPGRVITYTVESKGHRREVTVPVVLFGVRDFVLVFGITFTCGLVLYALGIVVYLLKPNIRNSWVFLGLCFSLGTYIATAFEIETSYYTVRLHYTALALFPAFFLHLGLIFPERKKFLDRYALLEYLGYLPALLLAGAYQLYFSTYPEISGAAGWGWVPDYRRLSASARLFSLFAAIGLFASLFHALYRAPSPVARQRARMILFGVAMAFIPPGFAMAAVHFLKTNIPWNFLVFFVVFFPAAIGYSIVKHNLFDADLIIRRSVGYVIVTLAVVGAYLAISLGLNVWAGQYQLAQSQAFPILFTLGFILVFNPLHRRIQSVVDRIFFRKEYHAGEIIDRIGSAMTHLMEVPQILKTLVQAFMEEMFLESSSVMLRTPDGSGFTVMLAEGARQEEIARRRYDRTAPLLQVIQDAQREITRYDLMEDPKFKAVSTAGKAALDELDATLVVPLVYRDRVIGVFNLGEKKSGKPFNREDIELLRHLANQGAIAIENAHLFAENLEKQRMEEELAIARELQLSMLPAACPELEGFQIAAVSTQAKEVGGDFYDYIEMPGGRLGIVIGDVTGKSVSGALVMAASRSVFRLLSEDRPDVGAIMNQANRRIKRDIKSGMFVALLYAVIDPVDKTLALSSAGQTQPICVRGAGAKAEFLETEGDNFPLGILDEASYLETRIPMKTGDRFIFYTDGIVEAMNGARELFGFDRLNAAVEKASGQDAQGLLEALLAEVQAFVGEAPQHDDITVITIRVA